MKRKLKEIIHAINVLDTEKDVYVEGFDGLCIIPPVTLTPAGLEEFRTALNAKMHSPSLVDDTDEVNAEAFRLIASLAGYCPSSDFDRWFEGDDAKEI